MRCQPQAAPGMPAQPQGCCLKGWVCELAAVQTAPHFPGACSAARADPAHCAAPPHLAITAAVPLFTRCSSEGSPLQPRQVAAAAHSYAQLHSRTSDAAAVAAWTAMRLFTAGGLSSCSCQLRAVSSQRPPPTLCPIHPAQEMEVGWDLACQRAFCAEAERLHLLRHAHLVQLYGICLSGSKVGWTVGGRWGLGDRWRAAAGQRAAARPECIPHASPRRPCGGGGWACLRRCCSPSLQPIPPTVSTS